MENDLSMGNILIIDNSPENLQILTELTAGQNYQVYTAKTAKNAIESAKNSSPDLILLNTWLPDLNGFDLCKQLKSDDATKDVPVIFICSPDKTSDKAKCFQLGGADFITTPFQPEEVVARIQTHLNIRLMRAQLGVQEAVMRSTETSFRNLFDNMSEGVALHEMIYDDRKTPVNYRILSINPAFTLHTGLKKELVTGKLATDAFATGVPPYLDSYAHTAELGKPFSFETFFQPLDKHFKISVSSPKGKQFVTVFEDITERKRADEALRVSLTKYKVLFDSFPVGITISDSSGQITESNQMAELLLGLTPGEQERRTISGEDWRIVRPDGSLMPAYEFASVRALEERCRVENVEMGIVKSNNQVTWINVSAAPIPLEGSGVVIIYNDITGRKRVEESLRQTNAYLENLINYANAPIIVWDPHFRITRFNHAFEFLTGRTEAEVTGQSLNILFPAELIDDSMALIRKTLKGERWETVEILIQHCDGSVRTVLWNSATLFEPDGTTPIATIAQGKDITARKQVETELNLKNEELLRTISEKDKFFSIIAHDLRNPFNSFLGFTQIMAEELPTLTLEQIQKIAFTMRKSAFNLYDLLENLLEWSVLQRGLTTFEPVTLALKPIISEGLPLILETAQHKGITIKYDINDDLEVFADKKMLETLLRNLVSNAVKFTNRGGEITISAKKSANELVEISIRDTGIGINQEMIANLFRIDKNTNRKGTEKEPSTGLGLIICKDFIEKHGGNLWVESAEGIGSKFSFTLPENKPL